MLRSVVKTSSAALIAVMGMAPLSGACSDNDPSVPGPQGGSGGGIGGSGGTAGSGGEPIEGLFIDGLEGPVTATYDEHGLLHLSCGTDDDCYAALGYFHAANRFFFMDFVRNNVRGKLAELVAVGDLVLEQDYVNRHWFTTAQGEPLEEVLYANTSDQVKGHLQAYTMGVNAWIEDMRNGENGATLTVEYEFPAFAKENIRDWEPEDSAAVGLFVLNDLSNNSATELALGELAPAFDPALAADLFSPEPVADAFTLGAVPRNLSTRPSSLPSLADRDRLARAAPLLSKAFEQQARIGSGAQARASGDVGSNNWLVGPSRTTSGHAILANDPHLSLGNPSVWFGVELDAKSDGGGAYHVAGSTFPGLPSVMVGHNESIGWGVTTAYYDLADVYLEEISLDGTTVKHDGMDVPIVEKTFSFVDGSSGETIEKTFRWVPHHGPLVSEEGTMGISIRWRGHEIGKDLDGFFGLARATSVDEAKQAVQNVTSASQNFIVVDTSGNIGWFPYSEVPTRPWASLAEPPWLPLAGDGTREWGPPVPYEDLPQLENPPSAAIATANQDVTGASADGDPFNDGIDALQAISKAAGVRQARILELLEQSGDRHSSATLLAMQGDTHSLAGETITPLLLLAAQTGAPLTAAEQSVIDALAAWSFSCPTGLASSDPMGEKVSDAAEAAESIGCTAFHVALFAIVQEALGDEFEAAAMPLNDTRFPMHLVMRALMKPGSLSTGDAIWDDVSTSPAVEAQDEILRRAITEAARVLGALGGSDDWRWGRVHTLRLASIISNFGLGAWDEGPFAAPGGLYTVNVANPVVRDLPENDAPPNMRFSSGASVRFVVEADPAGPRMLYQLPGGSDLHRESPFYNNLFPLWLENEPIAFPFGPGAVEEPAEVLTVEPLPN